jgi:hypothetical protein
VCWNDLINRRGDEIWGAVIGESGRLGLAVIDVFVWSVLYWFSLLQGEQEWTGQK